jgi:hypothetical protein
MWRNRDLAGLTPLTDESDEGCGIANEARAIEGPAHELARRTGFCFASSFEPSKVVIASRTLS